jgi:hypothetical protein
MSKELAVLAFLCIGIVIWIWAIWPRSVEPVCISSMPPSFVVAGNYFIHCVYRGVALEDFLKTMPDESVTHFSLRDDTQSYAIAVVTGENWFGPTEFESTFVSNSGVDVSFQWRSPRHHITGKAVGVFMIPENIVTAVTEMRS